MNPKFHAVRTIAAACAALSLGAVFAFSANSQTAAPAPGRQAVEARKAVFTLIAASFRPIGAVLKGTTPYEAAAIDKSVARLAALAPFLDDSFPDASNLGEPETKAKPEIWTERVDFAKKLKDFQTHVAALKTAAADAGPTDAFKAAAAAVGQDCKACHDGFKAK